MKKHVLLMVGLIFLSGCGDDGKDGTPYLSYTWVFTPYNWYDTNPDIPLTITENNYYQTHAGEYFFSYSSDGNSYSGTYTITINEGENGNLFIPFKDGDDGDPSYFELGLWSFGPSFYDYGTTPYSLSSAADHPEYYHLESSQDVKEIEKEEYTQANYPAFDPKADYVIIEEINKGRYKIVLKYTANK